MVYYINLADKKILFTFQAMHCDVISVNKVLFSVEPTSPVLRKMMLACKLEWVCILCMNKLNFGTSMFWCKYVYLLRI